MSIHKTVYCAALLFVSVSLAQPIKSWSSYEDYCHDNPHAPTCHDGKPLDISDAMKQYEYHPKLGDSTVSAPTATRQVRTAPQVTTLSSRAPRSRASASPTVIQIGELDWRFAHPHPDLLIGMDLESLLGSELMRTLLRGWAGKLGATPKEQDQMLAGLGDAKRILISIYNKDMLAMMVGKIGNLPVGPQAGGVAVYQAFRGYSVDGNRRRFVGSVDAAKGAGFTERAAGRSEANGSHVRLLGLGQGRPVRRP